MSASNVVVIVGRPNVGKSTLFNRLVGHRVSIVHEEPGVTRDRIEVRLDWNGTRLHLVDTGGIDPSALDPVPVQVMEQAREAVREASVILFTVEAVSGLTPLDEEVADLVRRSGKKTALVVNKADSLSRELAGHEFHRLGFQDMFMVSALHGLGITDLVEFVERHLDPLAPLEQPSVKVAVLGRPNAGKSTLINRLIGKNRLIVDERPGTTRDAIDVEVTYGKQTFTFVDTAGLRRRKQVRFGPETFSIARALRSIQRADLAVLVCDAADGLAAQDIRILGEIIDRGRGCILVLNKWDLAPGMDTKVFTQAIIRRWKFLYAYPHVYLSALTGLGVSRLLPAINRVYGNMRREIPPDAADAFLRGALDRFSPPAVAAGRSPRFFSMIQTGVAPMKFDIVVNRPDWVKEQYKHYLEGALRRQFDFQGVPIHFNFSRKKKGS